MPEALKVWTDFNVAMVGATAALAGLLIVAVSVNLKAIELLPVELKNNPSINPPPETRAKLQIFEDLGKALRGYTRAWDRVKTN